MELPYICENSDQAEGLITLDEDEESKRTAKDNGSFWTLTTWEVEEIDGQKCWFDRWGFSIGKDEVDKLHDLSANA